LLLVLLLLVDIVLAGDWRLEASRQL